MKITDEILSAYAEGKVTKKERNQVRQYLAENPQELESVMMMMDEDFELMLDDENNLEKRSEVFQKDFPNMAAKVIDPSPFSNLCLSAAAFVPIHKSVESKITIKKKRSGDSFDKRLNDLLDDMEL